MRYDSSGKWILVGRYWIRLSDGFRLPVIQGGGKANTIQNDKFAFGDDDGNEAGHSLDSENTDRTAQVPDVTFLIRIQVEETAGGTENLTAALFAQKNAVGGFVEVTTGSSNGIIIADDTQSRADDENTTERLTAGAGTFAAGKYDDGQVQRGTTAIALDTQYTDIEFAVQIDSNNAVNGDDFELRVEWTDGTDLDPPYPGTYPTVTASIPTAQSVQLNTLSIESKVEDLSISPAAASQSLDTLELSTSLQDVSIPITISLNTLSLRANQTYKNWLSNFERSNLIAHWALDEIAGSVAADGSPGGYDGAYTGVDLNNIRGPDGAPVPFFDSVNDFVNVYSTGFRDVFDGDLGTISLWLKVYDSGVWSDNSYHVGIRLSAADDDDRVGIQKSDQTQGNDMVGLIKGSGTEKERVIDVSDTLDWMHFVITWDYVGDAAKFYWNGAQGGATLTGFGEWVGELGSSRAVIGSWNLNPDNSWYGWISNVEVWDKALIANQVASIYYTWDIRPRIAPSVPADSLSLSVQAVKLSVITTAALSVTLDTLSLESSVEDIAISPAAGSQSLNTLEIYSQIEDLSVFQPLIVSVDTLVLNSQIEDIVVLAGAASVLSDTLILTSSVEDIVVSPSAISFSVDTLELNTQLENSAVIAGVATIIADTLEIVSQIEDIALSPGAVSQILDTLILNSTVEDLSVSSGAVSTSLDTLVLQSFVEDVSVAIGASTILVNTLEIASSIEDLNVSPGVVSIQLGSLVVTSQIEDLDVVTVVALTVILNSLGLSSNILDINVSPSAISLTLDTLELSSDIPDINVFLGAVSILLNSLLITSSIEDLIVSPGATSILLDELILQASVQAITFAPGAVTTTLDTLEFASFVEDMAVVAGISTTSLDTLALQSQPISIAFAPAAVSLPVDTLILNSQAIDATLAIIILAFAGGVSISDELISDILISDELISNVSIMDSDNA